MHLLLTNDDGISAPGLELLARESRKMARVTVVAPMQQMSATSQGITLRNSLIVKKEAYPIPDVTAYSVSGTPADCVKVALTALFAQNPPDYVFSGINNGLNAGYDVAYSGTCAAAFEALMLGVPAAAWSLEKRETRLTGTTEAYLYPLMEEVLQNPLTDSIWNINFPNLPLDQCKGILRHRQPAPCQMIRDGFGLAPGRPTDDPWDSTPATGALANLSEGDQVELWNIGSWTPRPDAPDTSDLAAVLDGFISIGTVHSPVL
ncbi:MAG: 5'/3'-nucleotidase SurE [Lachnospiraceae bacterium]|nr:5'/3'-nucleotidase SurE [Lachnospiraceae bacterium]